VSPSSPRPRPTPGAPDDWGVERLRPGAFPELRAKQLVEAGYLRKIPLDPITKRSDTWVFDYEQADKDAPPPETDLADQPGIIDVHSGSPLLSLDGVPYREW